MKTKTKWVAEGILKLWEEDIWETGCTTGHSSGCINEVLEGDTPDEVINAFAEWLGIPVENAEKNCGGDLGRVNISRMENDNGDEATEKELELWKTRECKIWYASYSILIKLVTEISEIEI